METKGTPLYRKQLPESEIINICKHLVGNNSIRSIERITGYHRDTIGRFLKDVAEHAAEMNEYLIKIVLGSHHSNAMNYGTMSKKTEKY